MAHRRECHLMACKWHMRAESGVFVASCEGLDGGGAAARLDGGIAFSPIECPDGLRWRGNRNTETGGSKRFL
jgi:hypothetical protein